MAIGQEVSVTLLQMVMAFGAVANDGVLMYPRICLKVDGYGDTGAGDGGPRQIRRVISAQTARRLRAILTNVVSDGTGRAAKLENIPVGGKTGTSQKLDRETGAYSLTRVYSSFIGFVPADHPVLLCAIVIDEPQDGRGGGQAAAPAFRKIMTQILSNTNLDYAERILDKQGSGGAPEGDRGMNPMPDVCGRERHTAEQLCGAALLDVDIVGTGGRICHQSRAAGRMTAPGTKVVLYASDGPGTGPALVRMPDCVGTDLRDAINALSLKGLAPHVSGAGTVRRQCPVPGVALQPAEPCTLFCSFEG
jgi:membrane peptidoglycan carboxypeptidase